MLNLSTAGTYTVVRVKIYVKHFQGAQIAYFIWLIYLALALGLTADGFFVPILTRISDLFGLRYS